MKKIPLKSIWIIIALFMLVSCSRLLDQDNDNSNDGFHEILLWHTWEGAQESALNELLINFTELFPDVIIVAEHFSAEDLQEDFVEQASLGLGPDIVIATADWAQGLHKQGLVRDLQNESLATDDFLTNALSVLQDGDHLYGLPFTLDTFALYYNEDLLNPVTPVDAEIVQLIQAQQEGITNTETLETLDNVLAQVAATSGELPEPLIPPTNLEELLHQANLGHRVAMRSDFYGSFWGIQTFGGQVFDEENRVILNQGGFVNWLSWLKRAGEHPNVILNRRSQTSTDLFANGEATYYVGLTTEMPALQQAIGTENLRVVRLPGRRNNPAGPLLEVEAIMFSQVASPNSYDIGLHIGRYLTSPEQQRELALTANTLPTNNQVRIDPRVSPAMAEFVAQGRTAIPIRLENRDAMADILELGNDVYALVLDGEMSVIEAANQLTQQVNNTYGFDTVVASALEHCVAGTATLWHPWTGEKEQALVNVRDAFTAGCPQANIVLTHVEHVELLEHLLHGSENREAPDLIIGGNEWLIELVGNNLIRDVETQLHPDFWQRYTPVVEQSARFGEGVYGVPLNLDVMGLYYNTSLVQDPIAVLDDVLTFANADTQFAMPLGFTDSYWGIAAFGARREHPLFNEDGRFIIGAEAGLSDWLRWLEAAQEHPNIMLGDDKVQLAERFINEEVAYLVGSASQLTTLQTGLGADKIGVVSLPSGAPLLYIEMLMLHQDTDEATQQLGLTFAEFLTDIENQTLFIEEANQVPINISLDTTPYPAIHSFVEQAELVTVIPNRPEMKPVFEWGDLVYEEVFDNGIDPVDAVTSFANIVDVTNGLEVAEVETVVATDCADEGGVSLWHSWDEAEALAWGQIISDFVTLCPAVQIVTTFIDADDLSAQLVGTLQADSDLSPPDFFIGSHNHLDSYLAQNLVQDMTARVDDSALTNYIPRAVSALTLGGELYGIPTGLNLPAFYYRPEQITDIATTFDNLSAQTGAGIRVGMPASFTHLLWGASAFGCNRCASGEYFDEQGNLLLSPADIANWVAWLETANSTGQFIFDNNEERLANLFVAGDIDYLVAGPHLLNRFQAELGIANVGVTMLPAGLNAQLATPSMRVDGFMFFPESTEASTNIALRFARFATRQDNQTLLVQSANVISANNLATITADDPAIRPFTGGIERSVLRLRDSELSTIIATDNNLYTIFDGLTTPPDANE